MTSVAVDSAVGIDNLPPTVRKLSSLPDMDYADLFTLPTKLDAPPEEWARAMFGDVPDLGERLIWNGLLNFRLSGRPSPATVGGWQIGGRGPDWIRLETASWFLSANLLVHLGHRNGEQTVSLGTFLRYERRPVARAVWTPLSGVHRQLVPGLLCKAADRISRTVD